MKTKIILIATMLMSGCIKRMQPEIYYIPLGYKGKVEVFFSIPDGKPKEQEGKFRIYKIDNNGKLYTQWKAQYGRISTENHFFMYINENGESIQIETWGMEEIVLKSSDSIGLFNEIAGNSNGQHFVKFYVGTKEDYFELNKN